MDSTVHDLHCGQPVEQFPASGPPDGGLAPAVTGGLETLPGSYASE